MLLQLSHGALINKLVIAAVRCLTCMSEVPGLNSGWERDTFVSFLHHHAGDGIMP